MPKFVYLILLSIIFYACKPQAEKLTSNYSTNPIIVSDDSLVYDTLLTGEKVSITKRIKVYNKLDNAIIINSIRLGSNSDAVYNIIVNGQKGPAVSNIELLGKDSIYVLVSLNLKNGNAGNPYLLSDSILYEIGGKRTVTQLLAWGQDANYLYNDTLKVNTTFNSTKAYVVVGNLFVDSTACLTINAGTKLFFANDAKLVVKGCISVNGNFSNQCSFEPVRKDGKYENQPGMWAGVKFLGKNVSCNLSWLTLKNADYGLDFSEATPIAKVNVLNCRFFNFVDKAISIKDGNYVFANCLAYKSINELLFANGNGNVSVYNSSFCNNSTGFSRQYPSVNFSDSLTTNFNVTFNNNIVAGDLAEEFKLNLKSGTSIFKVNNNMLKGKTTNKYLNNLFYAKSTEFKFKNEIEYNFAVDTVTTTPLLISPTINYGIAIPGITDKQDLNGKFRDGQPDLGPFEKF